MVERLRPFLKKYNLLFGIIGSILVMLSSLLILLIGTGNLRAEFNFLLHMVFPNTLGKIFILLWCANYWFTTEYDRNINVFARNLFFLTLVSMIITFFDYEMYLFFLVQSVTSLFLTILMCLLVAQRRFAIRSKKYAARLYIVNVFLYLCVAVFLFNITTSFENQYVFLLIFTMITQIFMIIAMVAVRIVERRFMEALESSKDDLSTGEFSD